MEKMMTWKVLTGLGLACIIIGLLAAGDREGFIGVILGITGATFLNGGFRFYLADR